MSKFKVFLVLDQTTVSEALEESIATCGFVCCGKSYDAVVALSEINDTVPDIILMDIVVGNDKASVTLAHEINATSKIPFIFLINNQSDRYQAKIKETKPMGFISKPVQLHEVKPNIMLSIVNHTLTTTPVDSEIPFGNEVVEYLMDEISKLVHGNEITMTRLEAIAHMKEAHLRRFLKQRTGLSPNMFILDTKLKIANQLLQEGKRVTSLTELASRLGFQSTNQFTVLYEKKFEKTPVLG